MPRRTKTYNLRKDPKGSFDGKKLTWKEFTEKWQTARTKTKAHATKGRHKLHKPWQDYTIPPKPRGQRPGPLKPAFHREHGIAISKKRTAIARESFSLTSSLEKRVAGVDPSEPTGFETQNKLVESVKTIVEQDRQKQAYNKLFRK